MEQLLYTIRARVTATPPKHPVPYVAHVIGWLFLLPGYYDYFLRIGMPPSGPRDLAVLVIFQVLFFYIAIGWLLPRAFRRRNKRHYRIPLYLAAELTVAVLLLAALSIASGQLRLDWEAGAPFAVDIVNLMAVLSPTMYLTCALALGYQTLVWGVGQSHRKVRLGHEVARLERALQLAQQDWLRKQLNPHLQAGLLSMLRGMAYRNDRALVNAMNAVIGLMQFYVSQRDDVPFIPLSQELEQVNRLLYISGLTGHEKRIHLLVDDPAPDKQVIPMLLVTLVENQLKYGWFAEAAGPAILEVAAWSGRLRIRTENDINPAAAGQQKTGAGLRNIRQQLELLYGDRASITHGAGNGRFAVEIIIRF